jgi:hypothetical protein
LSPEFQKKLNINDDDDDDDDDTSTNLPSGAVVTGGFGI